MLVILWCVKMQWPVHWTGTWNSLRSSSRVAMSGCTDLLLQYTFDSSMAQHRVMFKKYPHWESKWEQISHHLHLWILHLITLNTWGYFERDPQSVSPPSQTILHPNVPQFPELHLRSKDSHCGCLSYTMLCAHRWNPGTIQSPHDAETVGQLLNESPNLPYDWYK